MLSKVCTYIAKSWLLQLPCCQSYSNSSCTFVSSGAAFSPCGLAPVWPDDYYSVHGYVLFLHASYTAVYYQLRNRKYHSSRWQVKRQRERRKSFGTSRHMHQKGLFDRQVYRPAHRPVELAIATSMAKAVGGHHPGFGGEQRENATIGSQRRTPSNDTSGKSSQGSSLLRVLAVPPSLRSALCLLHTP